MKTIKVYDNFLNDSDHETICNTMLSIDFPWYLSSIWSDNIDHVFYNNKDLNELENMEFVHFFYKGFFASNYIGLINPILNKLEIRSLIRIRASLVPMRSKNSLLEYHTDFDYEGSTTCIYYLNDNDGYTEFKNGEKVESVSNRMVIFDSAMIHRGVNTKNAKYRSLINFNYF